jgi:hypothetical protein
MPTMTVLQALGMFYLNSMMTITNNDVELRRSWNDSKRTRPDDKPENSKRSFTKKLAQATPDHPVSMAIKSPLEQPASVPIVVRSVISRPTRSMTPPSSPVLPFFSPPPRVSFDSFGTSEDGTKKRRAKKSQLQILMEQSDKDKAREAKAKVREAKVAAEQQNKERRAAEKEAERAKQEVLRLRHAARAKRLREKRQAERAAEAKRQENERAAQRKAREKLQRQRKERKELEAEHKRALRELERVRREQRNPTPKWRNGRGWR